MRSRKPSSLIVSIFLGMLAAVMSQATPVAAMGPAPSRKPTCQAEAAPALEPGKPVELGADSIRQLLFQGNIDILLAANNVHRAKDHINLARGQLLPSLQLGTVISAAANPTFLLSSVQFLLPFLVPERWFELGRARELLEAEKAAFHALQLNEYASTYSLLQVLLNDQALERILESSVQEWREIERITRYLDLSGLTTPESVLTIQSQKSLAELRLQKVKAMNASHLAEVRQALGLDMNQGVTLLNAEVPAADPEHLTKNETLELSLKRAPENTQLRHLIAAAEKLRWQAVFGFINGASVSTALNNPSSGRSAPSFAFDRLALGGSFGIGFDYFPRIELSQRNIDELKLRNLEVRRELSRVIDGTLEQLPMITQRASLAQDAESKLRQSYRLILERYRSAGSASLVDVIRARMDIEGASVERTAAETDLRLARISMHRLLLSGPFEGIAGCISR